MHILCCKFFSDSKSYTGFVFMEFGMRVANVKQFKQKLFSCILALHDFMSIEISSNDMLEDMKYIDIHAYYMLQVRGSIKFNT